MLLSEDGNWFNDLFASEAPPENIIFDTQIHIIFLITIFILIALFEVWLISRFIFDEHYKGDWIDYLPMMFVMFLIAGFLWLLIINKIRVQVVRGGEGTGLLFSLALALMIMPYSNAVLTGGFKIESKLLLYSLFAIVVYLAVSEIGQIGLRVEFNIDLELAFVFAHKTFQTNSKDSILFITANIGLWLAVFGASFGIEMFK